MQKLDQAAINPMGSAVEVSHVTKTYAQWQRSGGAMDTLKNLFHPQKKIITALEDTSFTIQKGEFVAYAGPNGAGKSTTIKLLGGMLAPQSGSVKVLGLSPLSERIDLMKRIGILFGNRTELWWDHPVSASFAWKRTVWEISDATFEEMQNKVLDLLDIRPFFHTFARELSLGQRMRADLAMMLLHNPEVILLDEPTLGLDVLAKRQMIGFLKQLNRDKGTTILVTSHDMDDLEEMAQRILLLAQGRLAFDGNFTQLRAFMGCTRHALATFKDGRQETLRFQNEDISEMLKTLSALENIEDITFSQAPLEEALADLFTKWNQTQYNA